MTNRPQSTRNQPRTFFQQVMEDVEDVLTKNINEIKFEMKHSDLQIAKLPLGTSLAHRYLHMINNELKRIAQDACNSVRQILNNVSNQYTMEINQNLMLPGSYQDKTLGTQGRECPKDKIPQMLHAETHDMGAFRDAIGLKFKSIQEFFSYGKRVNQIENLELNFNSCGLTDQVMEHFAPCFYKYTHLITLKMDFGSNSFTYKGAKVIANCLSGLTNLKYLDLSLYNIKIAKDGIEAISNSLEQMYSIQEISLDVSCTFIGVGFLKLFEQLFKLKGLRKIWINAYNVGINDDIFKRFIQYLPNCPNLQLFSLDVRLNQFDKQLMKVLRKEIAFRKMKNFDIKV